MTKLIKECQLRKLIKHHIAEALKYDKEKRQYFPDYTDNDPHGNAGKYQSNYGDDWNYTRNTYKWSNQNNKKKFDQLRWQNDIDIPDDVSSPDRDNEADAQNYLRDNSEIGATEKAVEELMPSFESMIRDFFSKAIQKYPVLSKYNRYDLTSAMKDAIDEIEYDY